LKKKGSLHTDVFVSMAKYLLREPGLPIAPDWCCSKQLQVLTVELADLKHISTAVLRKKSL
jgi:hypothetical protein